MKSILAVGKKNGKTMAIEVVNNTIYVDGEKESLYNFELHEERPIAGTYYPGSKTMENVLNNLLHYFFDNKPEVIKEGAVTDMPYEEGRIY